MKLLKDVFDCAPFGLKRGKATGHFDHCSQPHCCDVCSRPDVPQPSRWKARLSLISLMCGAAFAISGCAGPVLTATPDDQTANLAVSPGAVTFGSVPVGKSTFSNIAVTNPSNSVATVSQISVSGSSFSVVGVGDAPVSVAAGGTFMFYVYFSPDQRGEVTGKLMIASSAAPDGVMSVSLDGVGGSASSSTALSGLTCGNPMITGAGTDNCTVTLNSAAGLGGQQVYLVSDNSAVTIPASVTIPAGATTLGFTATVASVSTTQTANLTATSGGVSGSFALQLNAANTSPNAPAGPALSGLICGNASLTGAGVDNCTVKLSSAATTGGMVVGLASNNAAVTLPATVMVPAGATSAGFTATAASVVTTQMATLTASASGVSEIYTVQLNPAVSAQVEPVLTGLVCGNASFTGAGTDSCTVNLNTAAPSEGMTINLSSDNSAVLVPTNITVPSGATSAGFTATVASVSTAQTATLTASAGGVSEIYTLQLNAVSGPPVTPVLSGLICGNATLTGSGTDNCTVTLSAAATSGGMTINLASNNSAVTVPVSVTVPAGAASFGFTATATSVTTAQTATLTASAGGVSELFALQLNAAQATPALSGLNCTSGTITGAGTDSCTVTLSAAATSGGMTISLASNNSAVTMPGTVTVPSGATSAGFRSHCGVGDHDADGDADGECGRRVEVVSSATESSNCHSGSDRTELHERDDHWRGNRQLHSDAECGSNRRRNDDQPRQAITRR